MTEDISLNGFVYWLAELKKLVNEPTVKVREPTGEITNIAPNKATKA